MLPRREIDPAALRPLDDLGASYRELGPLVLSYVRRMVPDGQAEDVVQQTFLEAWQHRDRFEPGRPLEPWLLSIARRRAIDVLRRRYRAAEREAGTEVAAPAVPAGASWADAAAVRRALASLPLAQREPLVLAYFAGLTQSEIADRLGEPLGTVKARMARGMQRLATILVDDEEEG